MYVQVHGAMPYVTQEIFVQTATVLISFGGVLGRIGPLQALWMAFIEVRVLFSVRLYALVDTRRYH